MVDNENDKDPRTATGTDPEVLGAGVTEGIKSTEKGTGEPGSRGTAGTVMDDSRPTDAASEGDFPVDEPAQ